jgi:hypothetical protein
MESNTRSPIFSDFGELLEGIVTVRAFSAEKRFLDNLHRKIDTTTKVRGDISIFGSKVPKQCFTDVVHLLDDEPMADVEFRRVERFGCTCDFVVLDCNVGGRCCWLCWFVYY